MGLVIAVIFAATMSASSGEINSLATVTVVDIYQRHFRRDASDHHYLMASRWATLFWGAYAVAFAGLGQAAGLADRGRQHGGLAVLRLAAGLLRAGVRLPRVRGTAAFCGHAGRRSRHLRDVPVHRYFLALVQRDRLRGGGGASLWPSRLLRPEPLPPHQLRSQHDSAPAMRRQNR